MISLFSYLIIFLLGLIIGSFLNSIIYRLSAGESFLFKRSYCPYCKKILIWQDLIPILSFLILKGKCRYCHQKISWQYPLVELATGLIFLLIFNFSAQGGPALGWHFPFFIFLISCFLIVIFVYDLRHYLIPDKIIYPAIAITFLYRLFDIWPPTKFWWGVGLALLPSVFFLAIILFSRGQWMGFGDFKLAVLMGLFLGFPNILVALFLAVFLGAIMGVGLVISGQKTFKSEIPFGPFLVIGTFSALFWGEKLVNWYLNFL